jgi:hypothetical protein
MKIKEQGKEVKAPDYKLKKDDLHRLIRYATVVPSKAKEVSDKIKNKAAGAILAAFAFVIALVWRDVIKEGVNEIINRLGIEGSGYIYTVISASLVTTVCVIGIIFFSKWGEKK